MNNVKRIPWKIVFLVYFCTYFYSSVSLALSAENFFQQKDIATAQLSPNGLYLASLRQVDGNQIVSIQSTDQIQDKNVIDLSVLSEEETMVNAINWIDSRSIAAQYTEINLGVKDLLDTKLNTYLVIFQFQPNSFENYDVYKVRTKGRLIAPLPHQEDTFLYSKNGLTSKVYKLAISQLHD